MIVVMKIFLICLLVFIAMVMVSFGIGLYQRLFVITYDSPWTMLQQVLLTILGLLINTYSFSTVWRAMHPPIPPRYCPACGNTTDLIIKHGKRQWWCFDCGAEGHISPKAYIDGETQKILKGIDIA